VRSPIALDNRIISLKKDPQGLQILEIEPGRYSVLTDDRSYDVRVGPGFVVIDGQTIAVRSNDPREGSGSDDLSAASGQQTLKASMPGRIVRVLVEQGDSVSAGQGIVVVEAMKMQTEMKAQTAGVVIALTAKEGNTVAAGEVLAVIE
jgi:biotin carboxyl carrier protein